MLLFKCFGQYEHFFDKDIRVSFCDATSSFAAIFCKGIVGISIATCSNLPEVFLLWKCLQVARNQTHSVKSLLSMTAYQKRQR